MRKLTYPTQGTLREYFKYNRKTGVFVWRLKPSNSVNAGDIAGSCTNHSGYINIGLKGKIFSAHRMAWIYCNGDIDKSIHIDHINGVKTDNRIANLRVATNAQNMQNVALYSNNTSGFRGVSWISTRERWRSQIRVNGKLKILGDFINKEDAILSAKKARDKFFTHHKTSHSS